MLNPPAPKWSDGQPMTDLDGKPLLFVLLKVQCAECHRRLGNLINATNHLVAYCIFCRPPQVGVER